MTRGLLAIAGYGALMVGTGLLAVLTPADAGTGTEPVRTLADAPVVAPVQVPTVTPQHVPVTTTGTSGPTGRVDPSATPTQAEVGTVLGVTDPFEPAALQLWSGHTAPVVAADVRADGSLVVPDDPRTVGWWTGGSKPGEAFGHVVIAGHVDKARVGLGILAELTGARNGQVVTLRAGDRVQRYRVTGRRQIAKADLPREPSIFRVDGAPMLLLITCGGRFDPATHRYDDNFIVQAEPV